MTTVILMMAIMVTIVMLQMVVKRWVGKWCRLNYRSPVKLFSDESSLPPAANLKQALQSGGCASDQMFKWRV